MEAARFTRRGFLRAGSGALLGALALGATGRTGKVLAAAEVFEGHPDRFGMLTDTTMCLGCRLCEAACNQANGLPEPQVPFTDRAVFDVQRKPQPGVWTVVNRYDVGGQPVFRKVQCMHCNEPACVSACPAGALKKTPEGPVLYVEKLCIGCRYCLNACPYTMLAYSYDDPLTPAVHKCAMCFNRVTGEGKTPACAEACPARATVFGKRSELLAAARDKIAQNPGKYVDQVYGEKEAGGASWLYLAGVPFGQLGLPADLGTTPYPEFTRNWLLAVPLVIVIWPALLMGIRQFVQRRGQPGGAKTGTGQGGSV
jgi:formate dehydrogenase iron-sulfur subunit